MKTPGSSVRLCVLCGLRFLLDLNQGFLRSHHAHQNRFSKEV